MEGALLARVAAVVVSGELGEQGEILLVGGVEAGAGVEEGGAEAQVELLIARHDVGWRDPELGPEAHAVGGDVVRALLQVGLLQHLRGALAGGVDLPGEQCVGLAVLQVLAEVLDALRRARRLEVVGLGLELGLGLGLGLGL